MFILLSAASALALALTLALHPGPDALALAALALGVALLPIPRRAFVLGLVGAGLLFTSPAFAQVAGAAPADPVPWATALLDKGAAWLIGAALTGIGAVVYRIGGIVIPAVVEARLRETALTGAHVVIVEMEREFAHSWTPERRRVAVGKVVAWIMDRMPSGVARLKLSQDVVTGIAIKMLNQALAGSPAPAPASPLAGLAGSAMLSDLQHGELVRLDEMDGLNRFDAEVSRKRVGRFFAMAAELMTTHWQGRPPAEIVLACLGDNISGHLHEGLMATDDLVVPHQVRDAGEMIAGGVVHLAKIVGVPIRVFSIPGNHGRDTHKPWAKRRAASSWDLLATDFAEMAARGAGVAGVEWRKSASPDAYFSVFGWRFLANHGDTMGGRGGGTGFIGPSATIVKGHRKLVDVSNRTRRPVNYALTGHYHTTVTTPFGFANGSVAGYNEYARDLRADPEPAQQTMLTVHAQKGIIRVEPIYLGTPDEGSLYAGPAGAARPLGDAA